MLELTKKRPIKKRGHLRKKVTGAVKPGCLRLRSKECSYDIPKNIAEKYRVDTPSQVSSDEIFDAINQKYTKAGALLRALRYRENMTQAEFAKKIQVTQADLSKMENGKRPIGKIIAKRLEVLFGTSYRLFLE